MCKDEERKGDSNPCPASLDKDNVKDVGLERKVARGDFDVLDVGLRDVVVWRGASLGRQDGEDGAEHKNDGEQ